MRYLPRTLKARAMIVLGGVFFLSHIAAFVVYEFNRDRAIVLTEATDLADRITGILELADAFPQEQREQILAATETQFLSMYPEDRAVAQSQCENNDFARRISERLARMTGRMPGHVVESCVRTLQGRRPGFDVLISIRFPDGDGATFHAVLPDDSSILTDPLMLYLLTILALGLLVAGFLIFRVVAPLERLARAAREIGIDIDAPLLSLEGPDEVRAAASALNDMHGRLQRQLHYQRDMLGAVSHDLRSSLTRLQLRVDLLQAGPERDGLERVIADMHRMVQGVLDFVHGIATDESSRRLDLVALLQSLCVDLEEEGYAVSCDEVAERALVLGRPTALRRGFQNLILNAVRYGGRAEVSLALETGQALVRVRDYGPGIPGEHLDAVLRPFYRVDSSRNPDSGGLGLGLAIARSVFQSHGGTLLLRNHPEGGLEAVARLPLLDS